MLALLDSLDVLYYRYKKREKCYKSDLLSLDVQNQIEWKCKWSKQYNYKQMLKQDCLSQIHV